MSILGVLRQIVQTFDEFTLAAAWLSLTSNPFASEVSAMSNSSDHPTIDCLRHSLSSQQTRSCKIDFSLHEPTDSLPQTAIAHLAQAEAALHQWRRSLEAEGVRYGAIHTYPHAGVTRYNFYPDQPDQRGKKRRTYVSLESLPYYRAEIRRGQQCQQLQLLEAQIVVLMQNARTLA